MSKIDLYKGDCLMGRHNGSTQGIIFASEMEKQNKRYENSIENLIFKCRKLGFKAAIPNDGWVNRDERSITISYPYFDDDCKIGDKILLAFPLDIESFRPIILTAIKKNIFDIYNETKRFYFEDTAVEKGLFQ